MPAELMIIEARNGDGTRAPGAKMYFYAPGTVTPQTVYANEALTVAAANPLTADGAGRAVAWLDTSKDYKFVLFDQNDATQLIPPIDNYTPREDSILYFIGVDIASALTASQAAQTAAEAAQTGAETAETNATTQATNAANSATAAETARANAVIAQGAAETAQTGAETAQTAAETAQTAAETAQTGAETAETNAAASAAAATTQATNAATSATNAGTSETIAATSATDALGYEVGAAALTGFLSDFLLLGGPYAGALAAKTAEGAAFTLNKIFVNSSDSDTWHRVTSVTAPASERFTLPIAATQVQAEAGTDNAAFMTALRVSQAIDAQVTAPLASTANGEGASLVGIEDAAGNYTATTVEAALAEVYGVASAAAVVTVANLTALQSLSTSGRTFGDIIELRERASGSKEGGGAFVYSDQNFASPYDYVAADPVEGIFIPDPADATGASGGYVRREWLETGEVKPEWFGLKYNDASAAAANAAAMQDALDFLASDIAGVGGCLVLKPDYIYVSAQMNIEAEGITVEGKAIGDKWDFNTSAQGTVIVATHTTGHVFRAKYSSISFENITIEAGAAREAAASGVGNCGICWEAPDSDEGDWGSDNGTQRVNFAKLDNVMVREQPGPGVAIIGDSVGAHFQNSAVINCKHHGFWIENGTEFGRTATTQNGSVLRPGIFTIDTCRAQDNQGHGLCIGSATQNGAPYRAFVQNFESFRNALLVTGAMRYDTADAYINGENCIVELSAFSGRSTNSGDVDVGSQGEATNSLVAVKGQNHIFRNNRYISSASPVFKVAANSSAIEWEYGLVVGGPTVTNFASFGTGCKDMRAVLPYSNANFTNFTSDAANVAGLWVNLENDILWKGDMTLEGFVEASGMFLRLLENDNDFDITVDNTATTGSIVMNQAGSGDAAIRVQTLGVNNAIFGIDQSNNNAFAIDLDTGLGTDSPFIIDRTAKNVRIGGGTDYAHKFSVAGAIQFAPGTSVTPTANGDTVFQATSNTSLAVKHKGSDGTVRSANIPISAAGEDLGAGGSTQYTMSINNGQVGTITFTNDGSGRYGLLALSGNTSSHLQGLVGYRLGDGSAYLTFLSMITGGDTITNGGAVASASKPTGTTGTSGHVTVYVSNDTQEIYIENRSGGAIAVGVQALATINNSISSVAVA